MDKDLKKLEKKQPWIHSLLRGSDFTFAELNKPFQEGSRIPIVRAKEIAVSLIAGWREGLALATALADAIKKLRKLEDVLGEAKTAVLHADHLLCTDMDTQVFVNPVAEFSVRYGRELRRLVVQRDLIQAKLKREDSGLYPTYDVPIEIVEEARDIAINAMGSRVDDDVKALASGLDPLPFILLVLRLSLDRLNDEYDVLRGSGFLGRTIMVGLHYATSGTLLTPPGRAGPPSNQIGMLVAWVLQDAASPRFNDQNCTGFSVSTSPTRSPLWPQSKRGVRIAAA